MTNRTIESDSLVGLTFVYHGTDNNSFRLGDAVFTAIEDEQDGYRSSLDSVEISVPPKEGPLSVKQRLAVVTCVRSTNANDPLWNLVDSEGYVWLTWGTEYYDDYYYPGFVFRVYPAPPRVTAKELLLLAQSGLDET